MLLTCFFLFPNVRVEVLYVARSETRLTEQLRMRTTWRRKWLGNNSSLLLLLCFVDEVRYRHLLNWGVNSLGYQIVYNLQDVEIIIIITQILFTSRVSFRKVTSALIIDCVPSSLNSFFFKLNPLFHALSRYYLFLSIFYTSRVHVFSFSTSPLCMVHHFWCEFQNKSPYWFSSKLIPKPLFEFIWLSFIIMTLKSP